MLPEDEKLLALCTMPDNAWDKRVTRLLQRIEAQGKALSLIRNTGCSCRHPDYDHITTDITCAMNVARRALAADEAASKEKP